MLFPGTEMHMVTFGFICIEVVILFYLLIHNLARPDDKTSFLDAFLIVVLLIYNITGGLLPDPRLPGSYFLQESIAYATGFMAPCYFPYYILRAFDLQKMRFHAYRGVYYFLVVPYILFVAVFALSGSIDKAKDILAIPVLYAVWVLASTFKAIRHKYSKRSYTQEAKEEFIVLLLCLTPWLCLPVITYFDISQSVEATTTNTGFLLLLALHLKRNITILKTEHERLIVSEHRLMKWNEHLQEEVEKRTREIERITKDEKFRINCTQFHLTTREKEIALLVFNGNTYKEVAESLYISERTVAKHLQNIFEKISVSNRVELVYKLGA